MKFLILFVVAMVISAIGFKKFVWFISLGYGFSIAGIGVAMLLLFHSNKKEHPDRFCDVGLFKLVRCPNYLGEVFIWTGVFVSGVTALNGGWQWCAAILGWVCIVYIMFGGAKYKWLLG